MGKTTHFLVVCYNNAQLKESNFLLVGHYYIDDISMCRTPCHPSEQPVNIYRMPNMSGTVLKVSDIDSINTQTFLSKG